MLRRGLLRPTKWSRNRRIQTSVPRLADAFDPVTAERAEDEVDVCIVGGGPAGLSAAIRLKQLEKETGKEIRVVVLEKGSEVGECSQLPSRNLLSPGRCTYCIWSRH